MKVLVDIGHPAHVHLFKHAIAALESAGHQVLVTASDKDVTTELLREYGISYVSLGKPGRGMVGKGSRLAFSAARLLSVAKRFSPDVLVAVSPVRAAPVAWALRRPCLGLDDTEHAVLAHRLYMPFVTKVLTPECYTRDMGRKQLRYRGYHELAYLHPRYFIPDPAVLALEGLDAEKPYSVVRFVSWQAAHDVGQGGFSKEGKIRLVREMAQYGRVLVSGEGALAPEMREYAFKAAPHLMHHFLYFAGVCVSEGATMASEAAVLGTPAIYRNTLSAGTLKEQQERYGLVFGFNHPAEDQAAMEVAVRILAESASRRDEWRAKAARLVKDKVDMTELLLETILGMKRQA